MTLRQRRLQQAGFEKIATAPRKSWLGKFTPLNSIQSAWVVSLLSVWGECVGGKTRAQYRLENSRRIWAGIRPADSSEWSDAQLSRINDALEQARKDGYKGVQAVLRAKTILWSKPFSSVFEESCNKDDSDFVESIMLETFNAEDPVYQVGMRFYTTRDKMSDIARDLQSIAPWLSNSEARRRVRWCLEIFKAKAFLGIKRSGY